MRRGILGYLEKLKGCRDKYKIRVADYRIEITVNNETQTLVCENIAHPKTFTEFFLEVHTAKYSCRRSHS
ncbi:hypothetical protein QUB80_19355 [Chlorogloeopsis sp. ULAP01]|uniref:type II toxin-antitoxin system RelE family toxin n=1 Tax=Chlorogloeopsis sp. ULAP01 TaxID=3056483 RepID=UPI0025AA554A|nr:hypothetical protein [Chlorogloeopsis sp. ULAP01]MDM9382854.1 hypothetical protein [Chlorogloeopsis sp. ULAP01]